LYVQGAADDHESWSQGLTPKVFWKHEAYLLSDEDGIEERIAEVLKEEREATISALSVRCSFSMF
jgi:tRNA A64-2'-O-ribosylphosphate transferase